MSNSLQERLQNNSNSFEGLLSLIPAKYYYEDEDNDTQWNAQKQTKEQKSENRKLKLSSGVEGEGIIDEDVDEDDEDAGAELEEVKQKKKLMKTGSVKDMINATEKKPAVIPGTKFKQQQSLKQKTVEAVEKKEENDDEEEEEQDEEINDGENGEASNIMNDIIFDDEGNEVNSIMNAKKEQQKTLKIEKQKESQNKKEKLEKLRSALQQKIQSLKEKRKAPGSNVHGAPVSRDAILQQRRNREELKEKNKQTNKNSNNTNQDGSDNDSDSDDDEDDSSDHYTDEDINADQVMFQNIQFNDGSKITSDLQRVRTLKKKGPANKDIKGHLKMLEKKKTQLENKDELELIALKQKEKWSKVMLQAEGVKLKDNETLLKKSLKRKENQKRKSAGEWRDRKELVVTGIADRQKRREENLQIKKDNKNKKRKDKVKYKKTLRGKKAGTIKRAGFEGKIKRK